jgi:hypothetical protein
MSEETPDPSQPQILHIIAPDGATWTMPGLTEAEQADLQAVIEACAQEYIPPSYRLGAGHQDRFEKRNAEVARGTNLLKNAKRTDEPEKPEED